MRFKYREGNENLIKRLERVTEEDRVFHAYIFEGPEFMDKRSFAESFIKGILCPVSKGENCGSCGICDKIDHGNHEDIMYISADGSSIKDADIIKMQESLKTKPFGDRHAVVIEDSDTMTLRAQNRLLKTLEEPAGRTVIILLSENMENLTDTIKSRCVKYRLNDSARESDSGIMRTAAAAAVMALDRKPFYTLKKETEGVASGGSETAEFLDCLQKVFRDMLMENDGKISFYRDEDIIENIHAVETARREIKEGVSPAYAIKNLLIRIGG